ncbi:methyltransferase family protein [Chryseobacterium indologenes]|uniref:Beta-carotene 15,15'-monooxygenase n=1 Tax=Chryseobacterium indologenes TaxID=253 RepID=A0A0N0ZUC1_CHRID|nr:isoprenylcysteine carboxylmethyltransferase family protein [Chryseobacterium indologenes]KPE50988.1 beta-carotene 15,15'-monooxygenase [Chryseobacterium indologenes]
MTDFIRFFAPLYFIFFFITAFLGASLLVYTRTGRRPDVLPSDDSAYGLIGRYFKIILTALFIYTLLILLFPEKILSAFTIRFLDHPVSRYAGIFMMVSAFVWVITAQIQMKDSWRIGIDHTTKTKLVVTGLFRISRNPVFLGMTVALIGFLFLVPTIISFTFLLSGHMLMQIQIRLEEEYLLQQHGAGYMNYKKTTGRMLCFH